MKKRPMLVGVLLACVAGVLIVLYLSGKPDDLANEYRTAAEPATHTAASAMNDVFHQFDEYLEDSRLPASQLKGVDDIDEIKRRYIPLYRNTERALKKSAARIKKAQKILDEEEPAMTEVPEAPLVSAPEEVDAVAANAADYLKRSRRFLASNAEYVSYARKLTSLDRRAILTLAGSGLIEADGPGEAREAVQKERKEFSAQRKEFRKLKPHRDAEGIHEASAALNDAYVDYLDDLDAFLDDPDLLELVRASVQLIEANQRLSVKLQRQVERFSRESGLQTATRTLTERANDLEDEIADLGDGTPDDERAKPFKRPPLPKAKGQGKQKGNDDKRLS